MADTRHKNTNWHLNEKGVPNDRGSRSYSYDTIKTALLMDLRDEMKKLNGLFDCWNFRGIPDTLRRIDRRLERKGLLLTKPHRPKRRTT
jgi:hypothetical protein